MKGRKSNLPITPLSWPSMQNAPADDEPYTDEAKAEDVQALAAVRRREAMSFEDLKREFGL